MLNDQQIEAAARKLCELRGIPPDLTREINVYPSNLELAEREVRAYLQVQEAVAFARNCAIVEPEPPPFIPPPGPCECGHSFAGHGIAGERPCHTCHCIDYFEAKR